MTDEARDGLPVLLLADQQAWATWLAAHASTVRGAWLVLAKKGAGLATVSYAQAVEESLCVGWIDGQKASRDAQAYLQRFTPRTARSPWSQVNRGTVLALIEAGRMQPAGLTAVEAARANGRWEAAYAGARTMSVPEDLQAALDADPAAAAFFATVSSQNRYAVLYRLQDAKRPETRAKRLASFVAMLSRGETLY